MPATPSTGSIPKRIQVPTGQVNWSEAVIGHDEGTIPISSLSIVKAVTTLTKLASPPNLAHLIIIEPDRIFRIVQERGYKAGIREHPLVALSNSFVVSVPRTAGVQKSKEFPTCQARLPLNSGHLTTHGTSRSRPKFDTTRQPLH